MGRFDGYLFLSDMDGTLTYRDQVSPENQAAIRFFQEEGGIHVGLLICFGVILFVFRPVFCGAVVFGRDGHVHRTSRDGFVDRAGGSHRERRHYHQWLCADLWLLC